MDWDLQQAVDDENSIVANGKCLAPFVGMRVLNFLNPAVYRFKNQKRAVGRTTEFVQHETVTVNWKNTVKVLQPKSTTNPGGRGLGVQFILEFDGTIYQHGDIETDLQYHAGPHNGASVGIELVTPYYPRYMPKKNSPWTQVIDAPWAHEGKYVVPTIQSLEANFLLTEWLLSSHSGLKIPRLWRMISGNKMNMGRIADGEKPTGGILSHLNFGHADGGFPILYSWLRGERGLSSENALAESIRLSTGAKGFVDLSYYSAANDRP